MKTCPNCKALSKGNDGIAEWFNCGSLVFNGESKVNHHNQTMPCALQQIKDLKEALAIITKKG